jgi:hypothetical protein
MAAGLANPVLMYCIRIMLFSDDLLVIHCGSWFLLLTKYEMPIAHVLPISTHNGLISSDDPGSWQSGSGGRVVIQRTLCGTMHSLRVLNITSTSDVGSIWCSDQRMVGVIRVNPTQAHCGVFCTRRIQIAILGMRVTSFFHFCLEIRAT